MLRIVCSTDSKRILAAGCDGPTTVVSLIVNLMGWSSCMSSPPETGTFIEPSSYPDLRTKISKVGDSETVRSNLNEPFSSVTFAVPENSSGDVISTIASYRGPTLRIYYCSRNTNIIVGIRCLTSYINRCA